MTRRRQSKRTQEPTAAPRTASEGAPSAMAALTANEASPSGEAPELNTDDDIEPLEHDPAVDPSVPPAAAAVVAQGPLAAGLYLAATPIGAARDVTLHVLDALSRADVIAAEDTRRAQTLMAIHGIARNGRKLVPYHDHNGAAQRPSLLATIESGGSVVCISDAGTPLVADPGWRLAREAIDRGLTVRALPGASALLTALSVSGLPTDRFMFAGFLPPKSAARRAVLAELAPIRATLVFYESPRRLAACLADMIAEWGGGRQASVSRELTKKFEDTKRGSLADLAAAFGDAPPRGEIVICVGPPVEAAQGPEQLDTALRAALVMDRTADAARSVAAALGLPRRDVYARALEIEKEAE